MRRPRVMPVRVLFPALVLLAWVSAVAHAAPGIDPRQLIMATLHDPRLDPTERRVLASNQIHHNVTAVVFADGEATGTAQFRSVDTGQIVLYHVTAGWAEVAGDVVVELVLLLTRVGDGETPRDEVAVLTLRPSSSGEDCLIYDVLGANVHLQGEAEGSITFLVPTKRSS